MGLLDELGAYLAAQGVGTVGTDLYLAEMQDSPDTAVAVFETPGRPPELVNSIDYRRIQVRARARKYVDAHAKIETVFQLLQGLHETRLPDNSGSLYHLIAARQAPFSLGSDARQRHELACNFEITYENASR